MNELVANAVEGSRGDDHAGTVHAELPTNEAAEPTDGADIVLETIDEEADAPDSLSTMPEQERRALESPEQDSGHTDDHDAVDEAEKAGPLQAPRMPPRRHRKQPATVVDGARHEAAPAAGESEEGEVVDTTTDVPSHPVDEATAADDGVRRDAWPDNALTIVAALDPFSTRAPGVDGIVRIRATVDITEIDPESGQAGTVANVPVQILPMAQGFGPIWYDIVAARRAKRRLAPIPVALFGVSKRIRDQDRRYANTRWATLFGFEISRVERVRTDVAHHGVWRGRGTVVRRAAYSVQDEQYERVTLHVRSERRKPQLRGPSVQVEEVDVLVHAGHPHADRFRQPGARLLIEAEVSSQTSVLRATHPDLEGLDAERRARLRILRQGILIVTLGEFADASAEAAYTDWVAAGRPAAPQSRRMDGRSSTSTSSTAEGGVLL